MAKKTTKKKAKKVQRKTGKVFWVTPSPVTSRSMIRLYSKSGGGDFIVVCRTHAAAVVAPAKLPRKGQWKAFRFTAVPED